MSAKEANRKSQKLFPLVKMGAKYGDAPIHLKMIKKKTTKHGDVTIKRRLDMPL